MDTGLGRCDGAVKKGDIVEKESFDIHSGGGGYRCAGSNYKISDYVAV